MPKLFVAALRANRGRVRVQPHKYLGPLGLHGTGKRPNSVHGGEVAAAYQDDLIRSRAHIGQNPRVPVTVGTSWAAATLRNEAENVISSRRIDLLLRYVDLHRRTQLADLSERLDRGEVTPVKPVEAVVVALIPLHHAHIAEILSVNGVRVVDLTLL